MNVKKEEQKKEVMQKCSEKRYKEGKNVKM